MSTETSSPAVGPILLAFLAGAAAGAVLVALTTPKSGPDLRGTSRTWPAGPSSGPGTWPRAPPAPGRT